MQSPQSLVWKRHGAVVFVYRDRDFCRFIDDHIKIEKIISNDDAKYLFGTIVGDTIDLA
jgi:hypothetical protein